MYEVLQVRDSAVSMRHRSIHNNGVAKVSGICGTLILPTCNKSLRSVFSNHKRRQQDIIERQTARPDVQSTSTPMRHLIPASKGALVRISSGKSYLSDSCHATGECRSWTISRQSAQLDELARCRIERTCMVVESAAKSVAPLRQVALPSGDTRTV